jgi:mercuric ion binding protein
MKIESVTRLIHSAALGAVLALLPATIFAAGVHYQLRVDGLACPFCAYGIEKQLTRTDGVKDIAVDINAGTVTVTMAGGALMTRDQAKRVVKDAGFTLRDFSELPAED